jgi:ABC-2 type transport system permease protein
MFLIAVFFTGLGLTIASKTKDKDSFQVILTFMLPPVFALSGSLPSITNMPHAIHFISRIDPLTYGVDGY